MGNISNAHKIGFDRNILRTAELKGGKLRDKIRLVTGDTFQKEGVYQRMTGGGLPNRRTNRFADSPVSSADYSRRRVSRADYDDGQFMDESDIIRMCVDPKAEKLDIMVQKFRRQEDIIIQQALLGTAAGGDNGETDVAFDTDNIIGVQVGGDSVNVGFTYEKLVALTTQYGNNNVDIENSRPTIVLSYEQWSDMMTQENFINFDYTGARPVDNMTPTMVRNYMGYDFLFTNIVPFMNTAATGFNITDSDLSTTGSWTDTDSTDVRAAFSFVQDAALLEINPDIKTKIAERGDKGFAWYAYVMMSMGVVRMEEEKVIAIPCDQSPPTS